MSDESVRFLLLDGDSVSTYDLRYFLKENGIDLNCDALTKVDLLESLWQQIELHYRLPKDWVGRLDEWLEMVRLIDAKLRLSEQELALEGWAEILRREVQEQAEVGRRVELLRRTGQTGRTEED